MTANPHEDREVAEVRQLKRTNEEITRLKEAFEQCIERTRELEAANEALRSEITDHKRIEERLRKSEKRFRSYFELGLIGMAITSPTRGILEVNDVICEILGYERSELIQMTWAEIAHPDDLAAEAAQFSRVMAGEIDGYSMDKRWIRKDGKVIYSTISVKCLRRADGSVDYFVALLQGITERKHAEKTLRESREELTRQVRFLDATLLNAGDYVYVWNREKRFVYANRVLEKLWGWTRDEWFGKTLAELGNTPELVELLERHIEQVFETKKVVTGEVAYTSPSGVFGYYDYIFSPVFGEDGSVERVAGVSRNTTERRRTEEALRESEERFRLLVERARDYAIFMLDPEGRLETWNFGAKRLKGYTDEEIIGQHFSCFYTPEDVAAGHPQHNLEVAMRVGYYQEEGWRVRKDGSRFLADVVITAVHDTKGRLRGFAKITRDITERKRAEEALRRAHDELEQRVIERTSALLIANEALQTEITERKRAEEQLAESERRFRLLAESIPHHVWTFRPDGMLGYCNQRLINYTGLTTTERQQGGWAALHPDDVERVKAAWAVAFSQGKPYEVEQRVRGRDGHYRRFLCRAMPVHDAQGQPVEWFGTDTDIEERRQTEEALAKTQAELAHATRVRSLGELSTSIAHEVNQPLAAIVMNGYACLRWLAREPPNLPEARKAANGVIQNGNRASEIIRGVRALLKKNDAQKEWLDINTIIHTVVNLARGEIFKNEILLKIDLSELLPTLKGARVELQQVILNLVMNAIEAMTNVSDCQRKLIIRSQLHTLDDSPGVLIAVQDTGIGVAEENIHQVFDAFYTTKTHGLGMGLPISRSIIEAHGGRLWATRNTEHGMTVQFALPGAAEP